MFASFVSRFRILLVLLVFSLGMAGQVASGAMAMQMEAATSAGLASEHQCPECPGDRDGGPAAHCGALGCWGVPALPAQATGVDPLPQSAFGLFPDVVVTGIATCPDPHPPRSFSHT